MTLGMLDAADSRLLLPGWAAYASYVDGGIGDQPNSARVRAAFPSAHHLSIALNADHDADCLDVEPHAASPADVQRWVTRQHVRSTVRPCVYASVALMREEIIPLIAPGALVGWNPRLWTAHYGQGKHICGPRTCGELPTDADGTQWTSTFLGNGGEIDASLLADDFFGPAGPPSAWVFGAVRGLTAVAGHTSVLLSWSAPGTPEPAGVHHYQVTVRHEGQDVASYPRDVGKGGNPQTWQGGSLQPGTVYEAMVRAMTADGKHASPWAAVTFTTGHG